MVQDSNNSKLLAIVLVDVHDISNTKKRKLNLTENSLDTFCKALERTKDEKLPDYDGDGEIFTSSKRFKIHNLKENQLYSFLISEVNVDLSKIDCLEGIDKIGKDFDPSLVYYYFKNRGTEGESTSVRIAKLNKNWIAKEQFLIRWPFHLKKKTGSRDDISMNVDEIKDSIVLPLKNYLAEIFSKKNDEDNMFYTLNVFKAIELDESYNLSNIISMFADSVIEKFENKSFKLTKNAITVEFENDISEIKSEIKKDFRIRNAISRFSGRSNRTINSIDKNSLEDAIDKLKKYSKNNSKSTFSENNIPSLNNGKLLVSKEQIAIFTALLGNNVVERILNGTIEIEFFNQKESTPNKIN